MTAYSDAVLADSPLFYGRMDETAGSTWVDSSGNGRDGTYTNAPTLNQAGLLGEGGACVDFNGSDEYGRVADAAWMDSSAFTVHCLVRTDSNGSFNAVINRDGVAGSRGWNLYIVDGKLHCFDANLGGGVATGAISLSNSTIYHVAMVSTGTQVRLYVNGVLDVQVTASVSNTLANPLSIASSIAGSGNPLTPAFYLNGKLDEVVFVGSALSGTRIAELSTQAFAGPANNITHNANVPGVTSALTVSVVNHLAHDANVPGVTSAFTLDAPALVPTITHNANVPGVTSAFVVDVVNHLTHTANVPGVTSSFTISATGTAAVTHDANVPGVTSIFVLETPEVTWTDTSNATDGLVIDGTATWEFTPAVTPLPGGFYPRPHGAMDVAQAFTPVTVDGATASYEPVYASQPRLRQRVVIAGADQSFFRGYETVIGDYQLVEPFLYATATLTFPQILGPFERPGTGDLAFLTKRNRVLIQSVDDETGEVVSTDFKGYVITWEPEGRALRVEVGGEVRGPAMARHKRQPLFLRRRDVGRIIWRMVNELGVRCRPFGGAETGIILAEPSGGGFLQALEGLHAQAWTRGGAQWTTMPDDDGIYRTARKDRTTIDGTIYLDDARNVASLRSDLMEEFDRIYGTGTTPDGMRVNNGVSPGLTDPDQVPDFPGVMSEGDSGDDVKVLITRLRMTPLLNVDEARGGFDADVTEAVKTLQERAGLPETGVVNEATWNALWDLGATGYFTQGSGILPLAQKSYTKKWFHTGGGAFTSLNPAYDRSKWPVDRHIDFGANHRRSQMVEWAKTEIQESGEEWVGTIRLTTGAIVAGDHTPGTPITSILRNIDIRPGMNMSLPTLGITVHVSGVAVSGREVTLAVDTKARDAMEVWQVVERNRESRHDPARAWLREYRNSGQIKDTLGEWSEIGGVIDRKQLVAGWNVFKMVAGPTQGTIRSVRLRCTTGTELAVAVFARPVAAARLNNRNPDPLTENGTEWWTDTDSQDWLEDRVLLYQAGGVDDPGGYHPKKKSRGSTTITGDFYDDAQFSYHCLPRVNDDSGGPEQTYRDPLPILHVAVWASQATTLQGGRIMWPQAEGAV